MSVWCWQTAASSQDLKLGATGQGSGRRLRAGREAPRGGVWGGSPSPAGVRGYYPRKIWQISHANLRILGRIFGRFSNLGAALTAEIVGQVQRKGTIREVSIVILQLASEGGSPSVDRTRPTILKYLVNGLIGPWQAETSVESCKTMALLVRLLF